MQKKKENVSRKRMGKDKEGEDIRKREDDIDVVIVVGVNEKGKDKNRKKTCTTLRRSNRRKRKENAEFGSVDLPSLQKQEDEARGRTIGKKKRKLVFDVFTLVDEDFDMYDDRGNRSTPPMQLDQIPDPESNVKKPDDDTEDQLIHVADEQSVSLFVHRTPDCVH